MTLDTPTFASPVPGESSIEPFIYIVSTQGLDSNPVTPKTMLGLDLLEYPKFNDPRVDPPAVIATILYSRRILVTKKFEIARQPIWFFGTCEDGGREAGWFTKE